jgi:hypothetical protein
MRDVARKSIYRIPEYSKYVKYGKYEEYAQYADTNLHVTKQSTQIMSSQSCLAITIDDVVCMLRMFRPLREEKIPALMV